MCSLHRVLARGNLEGNLFKGIITFLDKRLCSGAISYKLKAFTSFSFIFGRFTVVDLTLKLSEIIGHVCLLHRGT